MLKRDLPVTHCTACGSAGHNTSAANYRCSKTIDGERCTGTKASAINRTDWEECPTCQATGYHRNQECPPCHGVGYLFVRPTEKQPTV